MKASDFVRIAAGQIGVKESPAGSNRTKYGKSFGLDGQPWCAIFEWWCGEQAAKKYGGRNPIPHNENAAYGQDDIVSKKEGKWILRKTRSASERKAAVRRYRPGDIVCFDFGAMDAWRDHTGIVEKVSGNQVICIEGNTTPDGRSGSQSNGGMVCRKTRSYLSICSAARPKFEETPDPPKAKYTGTLPTLPPRGWIQRGDKGPQVKLLQKFLIWDGYSCGSAGADGDFGGWTEFAVRGFQSSYGLSIDGGWGRQCQEKAKSMCK